MCPRQPEFWSDLIGLPYRDKARGPDAFDCFGIWIEVRKRLGMKVVDLGALVYELLGDEYTPDKGEVVTEVGDRNRWQFERVENSEPCAGDLVLMYSKKIAKSHVGVMLNSNEFLQCTRSIGVHAGKLNAYPFCSIVEGIYRYVG